MCVGRFFANGTQRLAILIVVLLTCSQKAMSASPAAERKPSHGF